MLVLSGCSASVKEPEVSISYVYITQLTEETTAKVVTTVSETEEAVTTEAPPPPYAKTTSEYKEELVANILTAFAVGDEDVFNSFASYSYKDVYNEFCKYLNENLQIDYKNYEFPLDKLKIIEYQDVNGKYSYFVFDFKISKEDALF